MVGATWRRLLLLALPPRALRPPFQCWPPATGRARWEGLVAAAGLAADLRAAAVGAEKAVAAMAVMGRGLARAAVGHGALVHGASSSAPQQSTQVASRR